MQICSIFEFIWILFKQFQFWLLKLRGCILCRVLNLSNVKLYFAGSTLVNAGFKKCVTERLLSEDFWCFFPRLKLICLTVYCFLIVNSLFFLPPVFDKVMFWYQFNMLSIISSNFSLKQFLNQLLISWQMTLQE